MRIFVKKLLKKCVPQIWFRVIKKGKNNFFMTIAPCFYWFVELRYWIFFRYFYKKTNFKIKIIAVDFAEYPLYRDKKIIKIITQCGLGRLLENMQRYNAGVDFQVVVVINDASEEKKPTYLALQKKYNFIEKIIFRDNSGFDFGAYNEGYKYLKQTGFEGDVVFVNSSANGPVNDYWLLRYAYLFHKKNDIGLCGISLRSSGPPPFETEFMPHIQSFFMYTSILVLKKVFGNALPMADCIITDKNNLIVSGEIEFSKRILNYYGIYCKWYDKYIYYRDDNWPFPFGERRGHPFYNKFANRI